MTPLGKALRDKYRSPQDAIKALGLDESLLKTEHRSMSTKQPTRLAFLALMRTAAGVNPLLAMDAKVDYAPIFSGLTRSNFKAADVMSKLRTAVKGKLIAKDEEMNHVGAMLKKVEEAAPSEQTLDESVSPEQHKAMAAAANGQSNLKIPPKVGQEFMDADKGKAFDEEKAKFSDFLRGKGMGEDDITEACDMIYNKSVSPPPPDLTPGAPEPQPAGGAAADETPEEKKAREDKEADEAEDRRRADDDRRAEDKKMVTKDEMTEAVRLAVDSATKRVRDAERGVRTALAQVKPWVGDLPASLAFDSAAAVHRHAAKMLRVKGADTMHADALLPVIEAQPRPGARPPALAHDAAAASPSADALSSFEAMYGQDAMRITSGAS